MSNRLLSATSTLAFGLGLALAARAHLADVAIEGPITAIDLTAGSASLGGEAASFVGRIAVMGVTLRVRAGA